MMTIDQYKFAGKKAIVRVDFNVPLNENGEITDDTRIRGALPTLKKILADGGAVIIMSHMGKPKGKVNPKMSLSQIKDAVAKALGCPVSFAPDCAKAADAAKALKMGEALLLENGWTFKVTSVIGIKVPDCPGGVATVLTPHDGELRRLFAACGNKMLGYLMEKEVQAVDNVLSNIKRPFVAIMGGSKVSTKIGIIENLLGKVDKLILCGGMTYTFMKAHGGNIGNSIVELDKLDVALGVEKMAKENGVELILGEDSVCCTGYDFSTFSVKPGAEIKVFPSNAIEDGWDGLDAGPISREKFAKAIEGAKTILWNGPAGCFECEEFTPGSRAVGEAVAKATAEGAFSLIGGGDSVACVNKFGLADKVSYISTGGGALLEAIEGKVLPGVAAIKG